MTAPASGECPPAVARRLPGRTKRRTDVLREYEKFNADRRKGVPPVLWPFLAPDPDRYYRWRVQLDCACIIERMTPGDQTPPSERRWRGGDGEPLPVGQLYCWHDGSGDAPYRTTVGWRDRREIAFPADPVEAPEWAEAEVWAVIRHDDPHTSAFWRVTLDCGHVEEVRAPTLDWKPDDGPRLADTTRVRAMTEEYERLWASDPTLQPPEREREHTRRTLAAGWPRPRPERLCHTCPHARRIVAYQGVGWLVPRDSKPQPECEAQPSRVALERQLRRAEAEAEQLRVQLAQHDEREDA